MNGEINLDLEWEPSPGLAIVTWKDGECECEKEFLDRDEAIGYAYFISMNPPKQATALYTVTVKGIEGRMDIPVCLTASFFDGAYEVS